MLQLPKAKDTSAVSGAGFMRLVKNVGDSISKIAGKKSDGDTVSWSVSSSSYTSPPLLLCSGLRRESLSMRTSMLTSRSYILL